MYKWRRIVAELFEPDTRRFERCPECKGTGWIDDDRCINCEGEGEVRLLSDDAKPYATMKDGPDKYLFRKDGKQKLVGSADKETCPDCNGSGDAVGFGDVPIDNCPLCDGTGEVQALEEEYPEYPEDCPKCGVSLGGIRNPTYCSNGCKLIEEVNDGYRYREEVDYEEDNQKIWHYVKSPGEDWTYIDRSPYAPMDDVAWELYKDFHKKNGRWPTKDESRKIEELEYQRYKND